MITYGNDGDRYLLETLLREIGDRLRLTVGPPGCGKTTYLGGKATEAAKLYGGAHIMVASLTRSAAAEVVKRGLPLPRDRIGTLHSHAYKALGSPQIVSNKHLPGFMDFCALLSKANKNVHVYKMAMVESDVDERNDFEVLSCDGNAVLQQLQCLRADMVPEKNWPKEVRDFYALWTRWKSEEDLMDFDDLIEYARLDTKHAPGRPAVIYLDEAQDHSRAELCLALSWGLEANGLVVVGDPDQALYTWRGACPQAVASLVPLEHRRVLSQSYRVPRAVHRVATRWIDEQSGRVPVEYYPRDFEGLVTTERLTRVMGRDVVNSVLEHVERGKTVMVLASCGYMLDPIKNALREEGVPFHNPYRVKHGGWNPMRGCGKLLSYLRPDVETWGEDAAPWTWKEVHDWIQGIDAKHMFRGAKSEIARAAKDERAGGVPIASTLDRAREMVSACFADGVRWWDPRKLGVLENLMLHRRTAALHYPMEVAERFGTAALRREPKIILGTIHSVKGGEADVVYLFPDLSPGACEEASDDDSSVRRMFYVGMTRAREELHLCLQEDRFYSDALVAAVEEEA